MESTQNKNGKGCLIIIGIIILIIIIFSLLNSSDDESVICDNTDKVEYNSPTIPETTTNREEKKLQTKLENAIDDIKNGKDYSQYRGSISSLLIETAIFSFWGDLIEESKFGSQIEQQLGKELEIKVKKIQQKEFPLLRKEYAKLARNLLWESDVDVSISGNNYTTLTFTGGIFAANKNIKDSQNELSEMLHILRFKKSIYKWYKYDDSYTYYTLYQGKDSDIVD